MDGFDGRDGVIIIAATNRPDVLDTALLRPGRFDRQVVIDLPDLNGRFDILKIHAKKVKLAKNVSLMEIARGASGFSSADLENLLNESALLAARFDKKEIERIDVDEARDKISFGRERKKLMDKKDKQITAYHEAGHASVQAVVDDGNLPVHKVTIVPRGQSLGSTMYIPKKDILNHSRSSSLNWICSAMGGRVAEELEFSEFTSGAGADIKSATKIARHMVCDWGMSPLGPVAYGENQDHIFLGREITRNQNYSEKTAQHIDGEIFKIIDDEYMRAKNILTEKRDCLKKLADALLRYETVDGRLVYDLLKYGEFRSRVTCVRRHSKKKDEANPTPLVKNAKPKPQQGNSASAAVVS
jgi:cell division protease FtsH